MPAAPATFVVELTPAGRAAVAVVLVAGPDATRAVDACFAAVSGSRVADARAERILLGRWGGAGGEELIACRRGPEEIEIHCHGGRAAVREVVAQLSRCGCEPVSWGDWLRRSGADPIRVAAQIALAEAPTARTAAILLDQHQGALSAAILRAMQAVESGDWVAAGETLDAVLVHRAVGLRLTAPWQVVIAGRPNVGKSSLLNALVGYQRAIVSDLPGTTRDVVGARTAIDGWPMQFSDTAGLHETRDELESAGIERANSALAGADLVLLVDEPAAREQAAPEKKSSTAQITARLLPGTPILRVLNKVDLLAADDLARAIEDFDVAASALTGEGIDTLIAAIGSSVVPHLPAQGAAVPFTADQVRRLQAARAAAERRDLVASVESLQTLVGSH